MSPALCHPREHDEVGGDGGDPGDGVEYCDHGEDPGSCDLQVWSEAQLWRDGRHPGAGLTSGCLTG